MDIFDHDPHHPKYQPVVEPGCDVFTDEVQDENGSTFTTIITCYYSEITNIDREITNYNYRVLGNHEIPVDIVDNQVRNLIKSRTYKHVNFL